MTITKARTTRPPIEPLTARTWNSGQSWHYEELVKVDVPSIGRPPERHMLRVYVCANAYISQSFGRIERWDGSQWRQVARRAGEELNARTGEHTSSGYQRGTVAYGSDLTDEGRAAFEADSDVLLAEAVTVLSGGRQ